LMCHALVLIWHRSLSRGSNPRTHYSSWTGQEQHSTGNTHLAEGNLRSRTQRLQPPAAPEPAGPADWGAGGGVCGSVHVYVHACARDTRAKCRPSAVAPWDPSRGQVAPLLPTGQQLLNRGEGEGGCQVAPQGAGHGARRVLSEYLQHQYTMLSLHSSTHFLAILPVSCGIFGGLSGMATCILRVPQFPLPTVGPQKVPVPV
jgi:hypothetical protein